MATKMTRFHPGEPVYVTRACLDVPALSAGVITKIYSWNPTLYLINFGRALQAGPIPESVLAFLHLTEAPG